MRRVELHFSLTGKTCEKDRNDIENISIEFSNENIFESVRATISEYFGNRALLVVHEETLKNNAVRYPDFYSAGWFISIDDERQSELVVVSHGDSMKEARKSMLDSVRMLDWDELAKPIESLF